MEKKIEGIWKNFYNYVSVFVDKRIFDKELREDCVQEIFIKINRGLPSLKDESKLESWIFQIARNTIADFNRKKVKQKLIPITNHDREQETDENINTEVADWIIPFIKQLPLKYSEPLSLYEIEGWTQKEISIKEKISLSGVKSRIQRGRLKLKNALNECCNFVQDKRGNILDYKPRQDDCTNC
ncbi:RNA polymerase sigma factor SigZ [Labilibacter sediminis]|nr:RNA polymerase sigma factor SigZ [Labilibacter sediminis]